MMKYWKLKKSRVPGYIPTLNEIDLDTIVLNQVDAIAYVRKKGLDGDPDEVVALVGGGGGDPYELPDDVWQSSIAGQIADLDEKTTIHDNDKFVIDDSEDEYKKKSIKGELIKQFWQLVSEGKIRYNGSVGINKDPEAFYILDVEGAIRGKFIAVGSGYFFGGITSYQYAVPLSGVYYPYNIQVCFDTHNHTDETKTPYRVGNIGFKLIQHIEGGDANSLIAEFQITRTQLGIPILKILNDLTLYLYGDVLIPVNKFHYFGEKDTDGSHREGIVSGKLIKQKRVDGIWVNQQESSLVIPKLQVEIISKINNRRIDRMRVWWQSADKSFLAHNPRIWLFRNKNTKKKGHPRKKKWTHEPHLNGINFIESNYWGGSIKCPIASIQASGRETEWALTATNEMQKQEVPIEIFKYFYGTNNQSGFIELSESFDYAATKVTHIRVFGEKRAKHIDPPPVVETAQFRAAIVIDNPDSTSANPVLIGEMSDTVFAVPTIEEFFNDDPSKIKHINFLMSLNRRQRFW